MAQNSSKKKKIHACFSNNGILYVTYKLKDKNCRGIWDAGIGRYYIEESLTKLGATNIVFGYQDTLR